jgi:AraC-like DNA-binding protein
MKHRSSTSVYHEYAPGPELRHWLVCLWTQSIGREGEGYVQRIVPDGCIDIVWIADRPAQVVGPMTRPVLYPLAAGTEVVGVRFHPGSAAGPLRVPAHHLTDREVPLREIWDKAADQFTGQLQDGSSIADKFHTVRTELQSRCRRCTPDRLLVAATEWVARNPGSEVRQLAEELGVTPRHLHRRFCAGLGYGPKIFQRILRFQRLLHMTDGVSPDAHALGRLAVEMGYADQPHMTREFQQLARGTPAELLFRTPSALAMSDLFKI